MFGIINRIKGFTELSVSGADTEKFLNECARNGVPVLRAKRCGSYEIIIALPHGCVPAAERIAEGNCSSLELKRVVGATCWRRRLRRRILPVTVGIAGILLLFWSRYSAK